MEDLAFYNLRYKAVRLLITILANVVIYRLLTRDALGLRSMCVCVCVCVRVRACVRACLVIQGRPRVSNRYITTFASMVISRLTALQPSL